MNTFEIQGTFFLDISKRYTFFSKLYKNVSSHYNLVQPTIILQNFAPYQKFICSVESEDFLNIKNIVKIFFSLNSYHNGIYSLWYFDRYNCILCNTEYCFGNFLVIVKLNRFSQTCKYLGQ